MESIKDRVSKYHRLVIFGLILGGLLLVTLNLPVSSAGWSPLRPNALVDTQHVLMSVEVGSAAYNAHPETQAAMIGEIQRLNSELQNTLLKMNRSWDSNEGSTRAVLVYLPADSKKFNGELKMLYLSIGVMRAHQPDGMRTDLIVATPEAAFPESLGCIHSTRTSSHDPEACFIMRHVPLSERANPHPLTAYKGYVDSMLVLAEFPNAIAYDVVLRTDLDTFLTPGFARWTLPEQLVLATGIGGYDSTTAKRHLGWVMRRDRLGLKNDTLPDDPAELHDMKGIGSTWAGKSGVMVALGKLTIAAMVWLHTQEFSEYEKNPVSSDLGWPNWHWPVLLLYGGHIAVNQVPSEKVFITAFQPDAPMRLDQGTTDTQPLPNSTIHMHCWHTDELFSKFAFALGQYADMDLGSFLAMESASAYAVTVAVSSARLGEGEMASLLANATR